MHYHDKELATSLTKHRGTREPQARTGLRPSTTYRYTSLNSYKPKGKPRWKINMIWASGSSVCGIHCYFLLSSSNTKRPTLKFDAITHQLRLWSVYGVVSETLILQPERHESQSHLQNKTTKVTSGLIVEVNYTKNTSKAKDIAFLRGFPNTSCLFHGSLKSIVLVLINKLLILNVMEVL